MSCGVFQIGLLWKSYLKYLSKTLPCVDPDPADGIPMTELPSSDAANGVSYPSGKCN